jgi:hypothetical protein
MLAVQQYLQTKSFDDLTAELGIVVKKHDTLPLAILNYDQIDSPKTHPIVRECRGLVLHSDTKEIVARSFPRFFNWGEVADEMNLFDFSSFHVHSKEDGSLVLLYHFNGEWHANTRGSFGLDNMQNQNFTWREAVCNALGVKSFAELGGILDPHLTYVCEFCSPWNKIVRRYEKPMMYLLTAFSKLDNWKECHVNHADWLAQPIMFGPMQTTMNLFQRPVRYDFKNIEEIQAFLQEQAAADPTFEGVVICDKDGRRWKVKSATYLGLHKLRGEGDNVFNPKHLLPFIMSGEDSELLTYFPEVKETFYRVKAEVERHYSKLLEVWVENRDIVSQKDFALAIQGKTPFTAVLFNVRKKYGAEQTVEHLRQEWRAADAQILKQLKVFHEGDRPSVENHGFIAAG